MQVGPYGDPREVGVCYERGTPVGSRDWGLGDWGLGFSGPPRQKSRVERLKAKVERLLT
jgi:hypothetical protein